MRSSDLRSSDVHQSLILIIDDDPTVLGEVAATLWGAGYTLSLLDQRRSRAEIRPKPTRPT